MKGHLWHRWFPWGTSIAVTILVVLFCLDGIWAGACIYGLFALSFGLYGWLRWEVMGCMVCTKNGYERDKNV